MSDDSKNKLKEQAKDYVRSLYLKHRNDDIEAWDHIINILWDEIDLMVAQHCKEEHIDE
jgi:hypothetical protein